MDFSSPHIGFTLAAYIVSAAALVGLTLFILLNGRKLRQKIDRQIEGRPQ
jgi:predicted PurR-regulated permease PerM